MSPPVRPSVLRPPATISPCRQTSGTPQTTYFQKAYDVSYPNSEENSNTETNTETNTKANTEKIQRRRQIKGEAETPVVWCIFEKVMTKGF